MGDQSESCRQFLRDELKFLKAMYTAEELEINEPQSPGENGQVTQLILRQDVDGLKYEVFVHLSNEYPVILKPTVFVRSPSISCDLLNSELRSFIEQQELCVPLTLTITQWISDYVSRLQKSTSKETSQAVNNEKVSDSTPTKYARFWIYSHHIRNKMKRHKIKDTAAACHLNGFFCPGKPGVIIVEGFRSDCNEFWNQIRTLNWQRIVLRHYEEQNDPSFFRLGKFREIIIPHAKYLAELKKILAEVGLDYGFALLINL